MLPFWTKNDSFAVLFSHSLHEFVAALKGDARYEKKSRRTHDRGHGAFDCPDGGLVANLGGLKQPI